MISRLWYRCLRRISIRPRPHQQWLTLCLVAVVACASLPIPLPERTTVTEHTTVDKDRSQPFPCQHRPCGCRSADQCWKRCCCFTQAQKLAWAKRNGVTPPDFVRVADTDESRRTRSVNVSLKTPAAASRGTDELRNRTSSCCAKSKSISTALEQRRTCDETDHDARIAALAIAQTRGRGPVAPRSSPSAVSSRIRSRVVIGVATQACQGVGWTWSAVPWITWSAPSIRFIPDHTASRRPVMHSDRRVEQPLEPPVPPPRIGRRPDSALS